MAIVKRLTRRWSGSAAQCAQIGEEVRLARFQGEEVVSSECEDEGERTASER